MPEARLSVRVDKDVKQRAENVFRELGLTMSTGINLYLKQVALQQSIPFLLTNIPQEKQSVFEMRKQTEELKAQMTVNSKVQDMLERGVPVALYDDLQKRPYMEYPNGRKGYDIDE